MSTVAQSIYSKLKTAYPGRVHYNHIPQGTDLKSTTGIIMVSCISLVGESSKNMNRRYSSIYRVEIIGDKEAYITLVALAAAVRTLMIGYADSVVYLTDFDSQVEDINDVVEVVRIIQDYQVLSQ
jgi:hypothetical protein